MKSVMRIGDFSFSFLDRGRSPNCQWANFLKMHITYLIHIQNVQERNKIFSLLWFYWKALEANSWKKKIMSRIYWHKKSNTDYESSYETHCSYETERSIMWRTKNEYYCCDQKKSYSSVWVKWKVEIRKYYIPLFCCVMHLRMKVWRV